RTEVAQELGAERTRKEARESQDDNAIEGGGHGRGYKASRLEGSRAPCLTVFSTARSPDTFEQDCETGSQGGSSAGECQADEEVVCRVDAPHQHVHIGRLGRGVAPDVR